MAGSGKLDTSIRSMALALLLTGGLVLGASTPTLAATELGSKPGASSGIGTAVPPGARLAVGIASGSISVPADVHGIALGRKPGVSPGSGGALPSGSQGDSAAVTLGAKRGIASGTNHIGEEIPQVA
jgi:hypothetical protein